MQTPLLKNFPDQFETERLLIRPARTGDGKTLYESIAASLGELREFPASIAWAMSEQSVENSEHHCRESQAHYLLRSYFTYLIFLKDGGQHVATSVLFGFDWTVPKCEIGFWGHSHFARRGFVTEGVCAVTEFGLTHLGLRRIEAKPDEGNGPSCRVCQRAGYNLEGTMRHERIAPNGILRNSRLFAITR